MLENKVLDNPSGSSFQVCISLDVLTIEKRTSLIASNMMSNSSNLENMLGVSSSQCGASQPLLVGHKCVTGGAQAIKLGASLH